MFTSVHTRLKGISAWETRSPSAIGCCGHRLPAQVEHHAGHQHSERHRRSCVGGWLATGLLEPLATIAQVSRLERDACQERNQ